MAKNSATRYKLWAVQYNYDFDTLDDEGNPKNPDSTYFKNIDLNKQISYDDWLNWRVNWLKNKVIYGQKQYDLVMKAINKGYPDLNANLSAYQKSIIPKNKKDKSQKYGLLLISPHYADVRLKADKTGFEQKKQHIHIYCALDSGITIAAAEKFFKPSRAENMSNMKSRNKYGRYLLHTSEDAFDKYKHIYDENNLISNLPDSFTTHCVYHYEILGSTKNSKKEESKNMDVFASDLSDRVSAGIITADDAVNRFKLKFGSADVDNYRSIFKNAQADYLKLLFAGQKANGRNFTLNYINGLGHAGKSDLAEAIPKASDPYHRYFPTTIGGSRKTTDIANGWQGEPQLVVQEMDGFAEDFRTLASIFDPNHVSMASSRNSNVQLAIDRAYISNSAPESKWIIDNLISHARYEKNDTRVLILQALRELDLTPDELTRLDKIPNEILNELFNILKSDNEDTTITKNNVAFEIKGSKFSTSDSLTDWCVQLARRLTYNVQIFTPHQFDFDATKSYQQSILNVGDYIDTFNLNQRITEVHKLSELDAYLKNHNNLFHLPNLQHFDEDDGFFLTHGYDDFNGTGLAKIKCKNLQVSSFEDYCKDLNPVLTLEKMQNYIDLADSIKSTTAIVDANLLNCVAEKLQKITLPDHVIVNAQLLAKYIATQGNMAKHLLEFDPDKFNDSEKTGDLDLIKQLIDEDESLIRFSYDDKKYNDYLLKIDNLKADYENYVQDTNAENQRLQRVAYYNQSLASCPLFADDPVNDSIIVISKFDARVNRLVTGCAVGLSHCESYEDYRKNVDKVGIAIAKIEGTYQKEASDYINPNDIVKKLQDIAVNGLAED